MESPSQRQTISSTPVSVSKEFIPRIELSPKFDALHKIADKYYGPMSKIAAKSDDEQKEFTSEGVEYVRAASLIAVAALRAAERAGMVAEKSA